METNKKEVQYSVGFEGYDDSVLQGRDVYDNGYLQIDVKSVEYGPWTMETEWI